MQFEFVYYVDNEKKIKRTCDLATLQKLAIIRSDYWVDGVMDIKPEFVDVNNIEIDPSLNIAQAGGNTPQEIGQYTNVFDEELFQPFLDGLPLVRKNEDGSYTTIGGYKRILGKKRSQRKDEISPNVPVLVVTFDKEKEAKAILTLNSIENSPTNTKKPAKKYRSKESLARSLNAMLEQDGLDINDENMSDAVLDGYLAPLKVSYENLTRKQISDEAKRLKGAYVPEPLTSDEIVQEMDRQLRKFYPNAKSNDWKLIDAGQRVQIIKPSKGFSGKLEFGTEIIYDDKKTLAALLGASPGASVSAASMLEIIEKCFAHEIPNFNNKIRRIFPSYQIELNKQPKKLEIIRKNYRRLLKLS